MSQNNQNTEFNHYTVMKQEAVDALNCRDGLVYVDCTLGGGGHSELILQRISPNGKLFAFDIFQSITDVDNRVTIEKIVFNKIPIFDVNIFNFSDTTNNEESDAE